MSRRGRTDDRVIRMFLDYGGSVLWFPYLLDYQDTGLTDGLVQRLQAWEESYYQGLTSDRALRSRRHARAFATQGHRLGRRVAAELGPEFVVEVSSYRRFLGKRRFRSSQPPGNANAAAAFAAIAQAHREDQEQMVRLRARGGVLRWSADLPGRD